MSVSGDARVLRAARVVTPAQVLDDGWVSVKDGRVTGVGQGRAPGGPSEVVGPWLLPGFVDIHVHGGGGHDFSGSKVEMAAAVSFHARHGTTSTLVSLASAPPAALIERLGWAADLTSTAPGRGEIPLVGRVLGVHLEGPFLSPARRGAHDPAYLREGSRDMFATFVEAARGSLRSVTLAPELPGALALIGDVLEAGATAAIGHTDATYLQARAAVDAGAGLATHLFNGMRPLHHRDPGPAAAALVSRIACEVINDGVHVDPAISALVAEEPGRLVLVTDAVSAAGAGDGEFVAAGRRVQVSGGRVTLAGTGTLAGSSLTMDQAFRRAVTECGLPVEAASAAASANPARAIGLGRERGAIATGQVADLVVLSEGLAVTRVMSEGAWVAPLL